jgi:hypothetical protein
MAARKLRDSRTGTTGSSQPEFLRDLRRPDWRGHFGEQPMRVAELALAGCFVASYPRPLHALEAKQGLVALRALGPTAINGLFRPAARASARARAPGR